MQAMLLPFLCLLLVPFNEARTDKPSHPTHKACEAHAALLDPNDFVERALGKGHGCGLQTEGGPCCSEMRSLFGKGGELGECLCNPYFYSKILMGLPIQYGLSPEEYVDMLLGCGVPLQGHSLCKGSSAGSEPLVQKLDGENTGVIGRLIAARGEQSSAAAPDPAPPPVNPNLVPYNRASQGNPYQPNTNGGRYRPINQPGGYQQPQGYYPSFPGYYPQPYQQPLSYPQPTPYAQPAGFAPQFPPQPFLTPPPAPAVAESGGSPGSNPEEQVLQANSGLEAGGEPRAPVVSEDPPVATVNIEGTDEGESTQENPDENDLSDSENWKEENPGESTEDETESWKQDNPAENNEYNSGGWEEDSPSSDQDESSEEGPQEASEEDDSSYAEDSAGSEDKSSESSPDESEKQDEQEDSSSMDDEDNSVDVTIDFVPETTGCTDVVAVASEIPNLSTLLKILKAAGVLEDVAGTDKVMTVMAPTDEAIGATLKAVGLTLDELLEQPIFLKKVLALHIIPGQAIRSSDLSDGQVFKSLLGEDVTFSVLEDIEFSVTVPSGVESEIILKDLEACSSIIHVLSTMLLPRLPSKSQQGDETKDEAPSKDSDEKDNGKDSDDGDQDRASDGADEDSENNESNVEAQAQASDDSG